MSIEGEGLMQMLLLLFEIFTLSEDRNFWERMLGTLGLRATERCKVFRSSSQLPLDCCTLVVLVNERGPWLIERLLIVLVKRGEDDKIFFLE